MRAHDIRTLATCSVCKKLGTTSTLVSQDTGVDPLVRNGEIHPACLYEREGTKALLALPRADLDKIRICDVPRRVMLKIMGVL